MVNQEILGGLKSALARGDSLQKAMITFFNAGYKREEIDEAAKMIHQGGIQPIPKKISPKKTHPIIKSPKKKFKALPTSTPKITKKPLGFKKKISKFIIIAIVSFAILFIGLLITFLIST